MKHLKLTQLLWLVVLFTVLSCKKEAPEPSSIKKNGGLSPVVWPMVVNGTLEFSDGTLEFSDGQHLVEYLSYLDSIVMDSIVIPPADTFTYDPDEKLEWVESNLPGFISLRAQAMADFEILSEMGWAHLSDIPEIHFIQDIAIRSVLNTDKQVIVGTKKYKYINEEIGLSIDIAAPQNLLDAFDALGTSATTADVYEDVMNYDIDGLAEVFVLDEGAGHHGVHKTTINNFHISMPGLKFPDPCNNPRRLRLENLILNELAGHNAYQNKATYTIDWGDGQTSSVTSSKGLNSSIVPYVEHTYANNGTYTIKIEAVSIYPTFSGNTPVAWLDIHEVVIGPRNCLYGYGRAINNAHWKNSHGTAWAATCWVNQNKNWLGWEFNRAGACTRIYKWTNRFGSWRWRSRKGYPWTYMDLSRTDHDCNPMGSVIRQAGGGHASSATAQVKFPNNFGWTNFYSDHQSYHNGQWNKNHQLNLSACY